MPTAPSAILRSGTVPQFYYPLTPVKLHGRRSKRLLRPPLSICARLLTPEHPRVEVKLLRLLCAEHKDIAPELQLGRSPASRRTAVHRS